MQIKSIRMVAATIAFLSLFSGLAGASSLQISYGVNLGGAQIMAADFSATLTASAYSGAFEAKTTGVSKLFSKTQYRLTTQGKSRAGTLFPVVSDYERQKNGKTRKRKLVFEGGLVVTTGQDYPASVLSVLENPVLDPISATFAMALTPDPCKYRARVFDGRDVYDIRAKPRGGSAEKPVCTLVYKAVAGDEVDDGDTEPKTYELTFVRASGDYPFVPISLTGSSKGVPFDVTATAVSIDGVPLSY